jgi:CDP-glycerol glycerophosphotransferase
VTTTTPAGRPADRPRLTIVVPIYNVARYLDECLQSIQRQTFPDFEVIMVDDGSTDSSAEIAQRYVATDDRFTLVQQDNHGLGHARNTGIDHASGELLAFVDSDDYITDRCFELLVGSLDRTGSDIATGNVQRLSPAGLAQSRMLATVFRTSRAATHVRQMPALFRDRVAWNKVYRRSFWDKHGFRFPVGVLYEDTPVTLRAHYLATAVDVISDPVYVWRERESEDASITQRRTNPRGLRDRMAAVTGIADFLDAHADPKVRAAFDEVVVDSDLLPFLNVLGDGSEEYRALFFDLVNAYLDSTGPKVFDRLNAIDRLKYHLVRRRLLPELLQVIEFSRTDLPTAPVVRRRGKIYGDYPFRTDRRLRIPAHVYRLDQELRLRAGLDDITWQGEKLRIDGRAYIALLDQPHEGACDITVTLRRQGGGLSEIDLPVLRRYRPEINETSGQPFCDYGWAGFEATLDPRRLRTSEGWTTATWRVYVQVRSGGVRREGWLGSPRSGHAQRPEFRQLSDGVRIVPATHRGGLTIEVDSATASVRATRLVGDILEIEGSCEDLAFDRRTARLLALPRGSDRTVGYPVSVTDLGSGRALFLARIPLSDFLPRSVTDRVSDTPVASPAWDLALQPTAEAEPRLLTAHEELPTQRYARSGRQVTVQPTSLGTVALLDEDVQPVIATARWTNRDALTLGGRYQRRAGDEEPVSIVLRCVDNPDEYAVPMSFEGDDFVAEAEPAAMSSFVGTRPLRQGVWELTVRRADRESAAQPTSVVVDDHLRAKLPLGRVVGAKEFALTDRRDGSLVLEVSADLLPDERGAFYQRKLQTVDFPAFIRRPLQPVIVYETLGKQYSDSPRAIHEELVRRGLDVEHVWSVVDGQADLPDTATPMRRLSREWYETIATAQYVVTNLNLPMQWYDKRPGQVVVQTWHGTPLKRIGFDIEKVQFADRNHHDRLLREVKLWDYLVSPNPFSSPIMRRAFRFDNTLLETGYPRNDIFHRADRDEIAASVRKRLGVPDGIKTVLYAPTWRDNQYHRPGRYRLDLRIDLARAREALGEDHVFLVRRHAAVVDAVPHAGNGFVIDVTAYPDANELMLATDVLITDYSSVMFDFANTGRPMLFFTYDLEDYRDVLRGFYFDFTERSPGPLIADPDELIAAVRDAERTREDWAVAYDAFTAEFCSLDDGNAAARVVDSVFGKAQPETRAVESSGR